MEQPAALPVALYLQAIHGQRLGVCSVSVYHIGMAQGLCLLNLAPPSLDDTLIWLKSTTSPQKNSSK